MTLQTELAASSSDFDCSRVPMGRAGRGPGMAFCEVCRVECAPGSMATHAAGQKHLARLRAGPSSSSSSRPSSKPCFYFPQGKCFKGIQCPYLHATMPGGGLSGPSPPSQPVGAPPIAASPIAASPPIAASRPFLEGATFLQSAFVLAKGAAAAAAAPALPTQYRDLLKRKQNVNLYISGGRVVWQFAYNASVIAAIKASHTYPSSPSPSPSPSPSSSPSPNSALALHL